MSEIYTLIGKAMDKIGAIGKDSYNQQQKFKYRGIDAVMNALNPVMREFGLFVTPEVIDHKREERQTNSGGRLLYSILTVKYTMYAPDGSNISAVVIGEGMDSGDKASNKALSVAFKYAMFQLFCIPTEEFIDPDSETPPESTPVQKPEPYKPEYDAKSAIKSFCNDHKIPMKDFAAYYDACVEMRLVPRISSDSMTKEQCDALLNAVEKNFAVPAEDAAV